MLGYALSPGPLVLMTLVRCSEDAAVVSSNDFRSFAACSCLMLQQPASAELRLQQLFQKHLEVETYL